MQALFGLCCCLIVQAVQANTRSLVRPSYSFSDQRHVTDTRRSPSLGDWSFAPSGASVSPPTDLQLERWSEHRRVASPPRVQSSAATYRDAASIERFYEGAGTMTQVGRPELSTMPVESVPSSYQEADVEKRRYRQPERQEEEPERRYQEPVKHYREEPPAEGRYREEPIKRYQQEAVRYQQQAPLTAQPMAAAPSLAASPSSSEMMASGSGFGNYGSDEGAYVAPVVVHKSGFNDVAALMSAVQKKAHDESGDLVTTTALVVKNMLKAKDLVKDDNLNMLLPMLAALMLITFPTLPGAPAP